MTPSEAHDSAWKRGMEHDEMTVAVRDYVRTAKAFAEWGGNKRHSVECERLFAPEKGPRFFSDVTAVFRDKDEDERYYLFEIKPKIYSAGALLRQIAVQRERMTAYTSGSGHFTVVPVVLEGDPLAELYRKMSERQIHIWDGTRLKLN